MGWALGPGTSTPKVNAVTTTVTPLGSQLAFPVCYHIRPGKLDYLFLIHKNLNFHAGEWSFFIIHYYRKCSKSGYLLLMRLAKAFKKLILMF